MVRYFVIALVLVAGCNSSGTAPIESAKSGPRNETESGPSSAPLFFISATVDGRTKTRDFKDATPTVIHEQFSAVKWDLAPDTEVAVQTRSDVIRISRKAAGDLSAKWARDNGNNDFQFWVCDPISEEQALSVLLSLFAGDGQHKSLVKWAKD